MTHYEGVDPFRGLGRSRVLTKGCRLKLLALVLATILVGVLVSAITMEVWVLFLGSARTTWSTLMVAIALTFVPIYTAFLAVLLAVTYHDLRTVKEGMVMDEVGTIFG